MEKILEESCAKKVWGNVNNASTSKDSLWKAVKASKESQCWRDLSSVEARDQAWTGLCLESICLVDHRPQNNQFILLILWLKPTVCNCLFNKCMIKVKGKSKSDGVAS